MSASLEEFASTSVIHLLRSVITGTVHSPGTGGYDLALQPFNVAAVHRPAAVVVAANAEDVAATVRIAAAVGKQISVFATGHGAAAATPDSIMVNVSRLTGISIDPQARLVTVGAGVRWRAVLDAASPHGLAGLCGSAPDAGVVGVTLGGGLGPIGRTVGFAADHVVAMDVVTADGVLRRVDAESAPDLFWALRGGGAAFGIVTSMTFRLFPIQTLHAGGLFFDIADAATVLHGWRDWAHRVPESVTSSAAILNLPPLPDLPSELQGRTVVHVRYAHVGDTDDDDAFVAELRGLARPIIDTVTEIMYADIGAIHADPTDPMPSMERAVLLRELPAEAIDAFLAAAGPDGGLPLVMAEIRAMGGALARAPHVPNAVVGRNAAFQLFTLGPDVEPLREILPGALESVLAALRPWATGAALPAFAGSPEGEPAQRVRAGFGENYDRLAAIRASYDPNGVLSAAARW